MNRENEIDRLGCDVGQILLDELRRLDCCDTTGKERALLRIVEQLHFSWGWHWCCWYPMTDEQAAVFGQKSLEAGKYAKRRIDDVPLDYLQWVSQRMAQSLNIASYLGSGRVKKEAMDEIAQRRSRITKTSGEDLACEF